MGRAQRGQSSFPAPEHEVPATAFSSLNVLLLTIEIFLLPTDSAYL